MSDFTLRPCQPADRDFIFACLQDPEVRAAAFSTKPIAFEEHDAWFRERLSRPDSNLRIIELDGVSAGQVRWDEWPTAPGSVVLSIMLAKPFRQSGLGSRVLRDIALHLYGQYASVLAFVKKDNHASVRAFERAGFKIESDEVLNETQAYRMKFWGVI